MCCSDVRWSYHTIVIVGMILVVVLVSAALPALLLLLLLTLLLLVLLLHVAAVNDDFRHGSLSQGRGVPCFEGSVLRNKSWT